MARSMEAPEPEAAPDAAQVLFEEAKSSQKSKKRKQRPRATDYVTIKASDHNIQILLQGQRPRAADLCMVMDPIQIQHLIQHLREDCTTALHQAKRQYTKKRTE